MASGLTRWKMVVEAMRESLDPSASEAEVEAAAAQFIGGDTLELGTTRRRASSKPNVSAPVNDTTLEDPAIDSVKGTKSTVRAGKAGASGVTKRASGGKTAPAKPRASAKKPKVEDAAPSATAVEADIQPAVIDQQASRKAVERSPLDISGLPQHRDDESELSTLGSSPEPPVFTTTQSSGSTLSSGQPEVTTDILARDVALSSDSADASPADSAFEAPVNASAKPTLEIPATPSTTKIMCLKVSSPTTTSSTPAVPSSARPSTGFSRPSRVKAKPRRLGELVPTAANVVDEDLTLNAEQKEAPTDESPTVSKASRKPSTGNSKSARRQPKSADKVSSEDLADDVPVVTQSRKRKAETAESPPKKRLYQRRTKVDGESGMKLAARKTPASRKSSSGDATTQITPAKVTPRKTPASKSKAAQSLPSPPSSQDDFLEASGITLDHDLLKISKVMTHREPVDLKPAARGKPEVWATDRQPLCETLPYYKSAHSGCYSNKGHIYAFMFDGVSAGREYMSEDVIIARMGGSMEQEPKTGTMYQKKDHKLDDQQPQSILNGITHENPLIIICGNKNAGAPTKMPHRYNVLDWFKPTHMWAEMTKSRTHPVKTIKYRFERLDRSKPSWFGAAPGGTPEDGVPEEPHLELPVKTCAGCTKSCPQVYLIDWMCTNYECDRLWKPSNGKDAPYGELDYHPAFLRHRTTWDCEDAPFSVNPGVPQVDQYFGDNLAHVSTRGVVCPLCGRCNSRLLFAGWRCETIGCDWKLFPPHRVVMPSNLHHSPWDMPSDGPSLMRTTKKPVIRTQIKHFCNYKVAKYTIDGVDGSIIVAKANKHVNSEPGGPNDMFRELQMNDFGLERRVLREKKLPNAATKESGPQDDRLAELPDDVEADDAAAIECMEPGARMTAFAMNFGNPYKFVASGNSRSFEDAPTSIRNARSRLNWAQRAFANDESGYQDFNEELVFAYLQGQDINYHDDGEEGLGPRIATLSLGSSATMSLRVKAKYFSNVSNTRVTTYEKPLPQALLESSEWVSGYTTKKKNPKEQRLATKCRDTYENRVAAWEELKALKEAGNSKAFSIRSKQLAQELDLRRRDCKPILEFHLTHGDIVIMEGEDIQKYLEHAVVPHGHLRYALTCRTILPHHLPPDQLPPYEVKPDDGGYDGQGIRRDGDGDAITWG